MFASITRIMIRKLLIYFKYFGRRMNIFLVPPLVLAVLVLWPTFWWFVNESSKALMPPPPPEQPLQHLRRNRSLGHYLKHIQILIEPSSPCGSIDEIPLIIMVSSAPPHFEHRQAVRSTWAKYQPTYFLLGLYGKHVDSQLVDNYIEAKQYGDLIVFDFRDHYQNLTLKTALMMQWTMEKCPQVQFMFKTDDDVLVNPWTLRRVLNQNLDAQLLGYSRNDTYLHRDEYNKWYVPRWLCHEDKVPKYLSGTGYVIHGDYLEQIMKMAYQVPLINLEDVYFTYLVAHKHLGLKLTHDKRFSPTKPWLKLSCVYWGLASTHSLGPREMKAAWAQLEGLVDGYNNTKTVCQYFNYIFGGYRDLALSFE